MDDEISTERSPLQSPRARDIPNPVLSIRELRDQKKEEARKILVAQSDTRFYCISCWICITFSTILFVCSTIFIYYIYSTLNKREKIDHNPVIISENIIDYISSNDNHTLTIICSNDNPCEGWNCEYIRNHFHLNPDQCHYDDYLEYVVITICILLCCLSYIVLCGKNT